MGEYSTGMGYRGITNSVAYELNLYTGYTRGTIVQTDGTVGTTTDGKSFNSTSPVDIGSGDYISVTLRYDAAAHTLTETLTDQTNPTKTYSRTYSGINIQSKVGGTTAYVGFTGGTGDTIYATQTIKDFMLTYDTRGYTSGTMSATDITLYATGTNGGIGNTNMVNLKSSSKGQAITVTAQANDGYINLQQTDAGYGWNEGLILSK